MKVLLLGEYSGLHNNLKDGLLELGHDVILAARQDGFKALPSDINFDSQINNRYLNYLHTAWKYLKQSSSLKDFDVLQIINPGIVSFENLAFNKFIINKLINNNKHSFLIGAGEDPLIWKYWSENSAQLRYSWVYGVREENLKSGKGHNVLENNSNIEWNKSLLDKIDGYIPIMYEYAKPYDAFKIEKKIIPIPINVDKIKYKENNLTKKIKIFHGLNRYGAKGTFFIEKAFEILRNKYPNDLDLRMDGKMSQKDYLEVISNANVIIDQNRSYSLAMNALLSMAQGKVVFGGNEPEASIALNYKSDNPAINIIPSTDQIVSQVEWLLENKNRIPEIGYNSRVFVEKEHHYIDIAKKYTDFWDGFK